MKLFNGCNNAALSYHVSRSYKIVSGHLSKNSRYPPALDRLSRDLNTEFTLGNCLFGSVKLTKIVDADKEKYSGYGIGFDSRSEFSCTDGSMGKNVIIFGADMSASVLNDNKNKDILILGERPRQVLDDSTLTADAKYPINFTKSERRFVLSPHYNGNHSFLFVDATKICQFKARDSEIKNYPLCLGNVSKDFTIHNMKKAELKGSVKFFSIDYRPINTNEILEIHRYLIKETL